MKQSKEPDPLPERLYLFDVSKVLVGDVILTASPGCIVSDSIRMLTGSSFSHAILVCDHPYGTESSDHGVVKFRLDRFAVASPANILVQRPTQATLQRLNKKAMLDFAESAISHEYSTKEAIRALSESLEAKEKGKFFCSDVRKRGICIGCLLSEAQGWLRV